MTTTARVPGALPMQPDAGGPEGVTAVRRAIMCCPECAQHYTADSMFCPFDGAKLEATVWVAPTDPLVDPLLGSTVDGRYRVDRVLGEGGTGTVYEVVHKSLGRAFAMKVLRRDVAGDASLATRFIQEARATASLKHPHIVSITDFGHLPDKTPYFVMERLTGDTLAHVCKVGGRLPVARTVRVVLQVASALGAAHEAGIVHRDLKPENLFLLGREEGVVDMPDDVRVVDFGAAKIAGATRITKTGIVFGTPHYMSPEQASGQPVDHRADIYALGVIMYELFTGRLPFEGDSLMGVLTKHMFVEPSPFAESRAADDDTTKAEVHAALEGITLRAMAKKPERRFQTMAALAEALEQTVRFTSDGAIALVDGWTAPPSRQGPPAVRDLMRSVEGADRADIYPSGDLPIVPGTSWRGTAIAAGGVVAIAAAAGLAVMARGSTSSAGPPPTLPPPGASVAAAPSPPPSAPVAAAPRVVHLTSTPPFAEVWQDGRRVGTAPVDLPVAADGSATRFALRAGGYVERTLTIDAASSPSLDLALEKLPPPAVPPASPRVRRDPPPHRPPPRSDGELVDPFSR